MRRLDGGWAMANPEHENMVRYEHEKLKQWRADHPDDVLDLTGANFATVPFRDIPLQKADFSGADLTRADFTGVSLREAVFTRTRIAHTNFAGCDLYKAKFSQVTDATDVYFERASLRCASFNHCTIAG